MKTILFQLILCFLLLPSLAFSANKSIQKAFDLTDKQQFYAALQIAHSHKKQLLVEYIDWRRLKRIDERPDMKVITTFYSKHQDWPDSQVILKRAIEQWALLGATDDIYQQLSRFIHTNPESSYHTAAGSRTELIRAIWVDGEFTGIEQEHLLQRYRKLLKREEITQRVDNLLWNEHASIAKLLIPKLSSGQKKLHNARIALMRQERNVAGKIKKVPAHLKSSPALIFERLRWRARKKLDTGVEELLLSAPKTVPYPHKWWKYRAIHVRNAIEAEHYQKAYKLLRNHAQTAGASLADALWLKGWMLLRYLKKPAEAYEVFYELHKNVSYPVSISRGAYWAGVAAQKNGNTTIAQNWYQQAAAHPATFYGQLATLKLSPGKPLSFRFDDRSASSRSLSSGAQRQIQLVKLLSNHQQNHSVAKFLGHLARTHKKPEQYAAIAHIAQTLGYPHLSVRTGKVASQQDQLILAKINYPTITPPRDAPIEPALIMAIARQESEFNPKAQSRANAMGLMQLLPSTAKSVARRNEIAYSRTKLFDPKYNIVLGGHYLGSLVKRYNGRYPLAIAAYNAGPGNVDKWIRKFGTPPEHLTGLLDWLERIPFSETRNYVQRVLENMHVYRHILGQRTALSNKKMFGKR